MLAGILEAQKNRRRIKEAKEFLRETEKSVKRAGEALTEPVRKQLLQAEHVCIKGSRGREVTDADAYDGERGRRRCGWCGGRCGIGLGRTRRRGPCHADDADQPEKGVVQVHGAGTSS